MPPHEESKASGPRYAAFISYRHVDRDRRWAEWLLETLERYRVPRRLRAQGFPDRIGHVFRDEDELPSSADLNDQIKQALARSDYLIVICSPDTPASAWVCREIELFCEMGRGDRILALLVDGEPDQSFPEPLRRRPRPIVGADGVMRMEVEIVEPLAADVRPRAKRSERQTKHLALLRILACLLGCTFDDLRQRDHQRQQRQRLSIAAMLVVALLGALGGGAMWWDQTRLKTAHFAAMTSRLGIPEGIGPLSEEERGRRAISHRFESRGGRVVRVVKENSWGIQVVASNVISFWSDFSEWRIHYRAEGGIDRIELRGPTGLAVRDESFAADLGVVKFDLKGRAQVQDGGGSMLSGIEGSGELGQRSLITQHRLTFDRDGFMVERRYEDNFGRPHADSTGAYGKRYRVDPRGLVLREEEIAADGRVHVLRNWLSTILREFDQRGELLVERNVDTEGRVFMASGEYAIQRFERDAWGNSLRVTHHHPAPAQAAEPLALTKDGYAGYRIDRNERGDEIRRSYFGIDEKPILQNDGYASYERVIRDGRTHETAYFDREGKPTFDKGGFHRIGARYDASGNRTEWIYFGIAGEPVLAYDGYARSTVRFENGARVETAHFGGDGQPVMIKDGYSRVTRRVVDGLPVEWRYFGTRGEPVLSNDRVHLARATYDGRGNQVQLAYFDTVDRPTRHGDGHARQDAVFNEQGFRIDLRYFDTQGNPTLSKRKIAKIETVYDELGQPRETRFFDQLGQLTQTAEGYARIVRRHERGKVVREQLFDALGNVVASADTGCLLWSVNRDARGEFLEESCQDAAGMPVHGARRAPIRRAEYDPRGRRVALRGFDASGAPVAINGAVATTYELDERGNQQRTIWRDAANEPVMTRDGYAAVENAYDMRGNIVVTRFLGADLKPKMQPEGFAERHRHHALWGVLVGDSFYGVGQERVATQNGYWRWQGDVDELGLLHELRYYDTADRLVRRTDGHAIERRRYDARGNRIRSEYLDADGKRVLTQDGYAIEEVAFDEYDRPVGWAYFGIDEQPRADSNGIARQIIGRDARGNRVDWQYFGVDGLPTYLGAGVHRLVMRYDPFDREVEWRFLGGDGTPLPGPEGAAIIRVEYNYRGQRIGIAMLDAQERPVDSGRGYARETADIDRDGRVLRQRRFDAAGHEIRSSSQ